MSNKQPTELAASLRAIFAARRPHLVADGSGPAWSIVGTADRLEDLQAAADALDAQASALGARIAPLQVTADGAVRPVFCGADCVDEGLCRASQSCDRIGAESVGKVNVGPAPAADLSACDCRNSVDDCDYPDCKAGRAALAAPAPVALPSQCAQCKKAYRHGSGTGCPKCAPGMVVPESEFRKPIAAAAPAGEPVPWPEAEVICGKPDVDEAITVLLADSTHDNAVEVVRAVLRYAPPAAAQVPAFTRTTMSPFSGPTAFGLVLRMPSFMDAAAVRSQLTAMGVKDTGGRPQCPAREAMGNSACTDQSQCWEPCGALGQSAAHAIPAGRYAPAAGIESEGGEA
jgi:hypothetical protein